MSTSILLGDVREVLASVADNTFDAVLCDPPYGLSFMGKRWDYDVPGTDTWAEVLRVCKPGAPLLAAFGTRTYHRGVVRIEDAGFEIRDCITWMYGSGFPKSLDVSKAIDAAAGAEREVVGVRPIAYADSPSGGMAGATRSVSANSSARAGGIWNEATGEVSGGRAITAPATPLAAEWSGYGTALKPAHEPYVLARKPLDGTVAQNVARWGVGALAIDACRVATDEDLNGGAYTGSSRHDGTERWRLQPGGAGEYVQPAGRWPANVILDEAAGAMLDAQSGNAGARGKATGPTRTGKSTSVARNKANGTDEEAPFYGDSGGASRFFYCAKASKRERGEGNVHPTVKPLALCEYLARLIMPPKPGAILVPFAGSGSEMIGALRAGWPSVVGIEREPSYVEIAQHRLRAA